MTQIKIEDDFSLDKVIDCGQCFRARKLEDGSFLFLSGENVVRIRGCGAGVYDVSCSLEEWNSFWNGYFDLGRNYSAIRRILQDKIRDECSQKAGHSVTTKEDEDPALSEHSGRMQSPAAEVPGLQENFETMNPSAASDFLRNAEQAGRGIRILRQDPWEMLITFIISQRKNMPAIASAVEKLSGLYGHHIRNQQAELFSFPTPEELNRASKNDLRDAGLGYRAPYVRDATDKVLSGQLDLKEMQKLNDQALFEKLMTVKGVGKKVANCICLFGFGRTGRAPVDVWIDRAIERCGGKDPFPEFGEYAGIMQQYVFYYMTHASDTLQGTLHI